MNNEKGAGMMKLNLSEISAVNKIQLDILKEFIVICEENRLVYYMVHGSLLGAVRYKGFFPYDDDIDVAMPRKDYDKLLSIGNRLFPEHLFVQSIVTEKGYPLQFAKIRNTNTAFVQPEMEKFRINQGIYIDVFPIDHYPSSKIKQIEKGFLGKIYGARITRELLEGEKQNVWKKGLRDLSVIICPSMEMAIKRRADLYKYCSPSSLVTVVGGKVHEKGIPCEWFSDGEQLDFAGVKVRCPRAYHEYLQFIYGDYSSYDPSSKYLNGDGTVTVNASMISTEISYKDLK